METGNPLLTYMYMYMCQRENKQKKTITCGTTFIFLKDKNRNKKFVLNKKNCHGGNTVYSAFIKI